MQFDVRVSDLLVSKICHDLVSPVGAINNGVELLEEVGPSVAGEASQLIASSAQLAARRLRMFRIAYGRAGSESGLSTQDLRQVAEQFLIGSKTRISWPEGVPSVAFSAVRGGGKMLLNTIIWGTDALVYGGDLAVSEGGNGVVLKISGRGVQVDQASADILSGKTSVDELSPKTIQTFLLKVYSEHFGIKLNIYAPSADVLHCELKP